MFEHGKREKDEALMRSQSGKMIKINENVKSLFRAIKGKLKMEIKEAIKEDLGSEARRFEEHIQRIIAAINKVESVESISEEMNEIRQLMREHAQLAVMMRGLEKSHPDTYEFIRDGGSDILHNFMAIEKDLGIEESILKKEIEEARKQL